MKYVVLILIVMVLTMNIPVNNIYAENGEYSKYDSLKLRHVTNPFVCLFEVNPELYDDWDGLKYTTISAIEEWILKLEYFYPNGNWVVLVETIPWEEHENKTVFDYPQCNIMINYEKSSNGKALGNTSLNFNKSSHKFMFINIFLESQKSITKIVVGEDYSSSTISKIQKSYPLSENTLKNIIVHEFGHGLGLAHFNINTLMMSHTQSVMVPSIKPFDENQILSVTYLDLVMIGKIYGENGWNKPVPVYIIKGCYISDSYIFRCF
jgi:predicted Zn-dependent protease